MKYLNIQYDFLPREIKSECKIKAKLGYDAPSTFKVSKTKNGKICLTELCDDYFSITISKEEAVDLFKEIIEYIEGEN